jgi:hypothetical protein
VWCGCLSRASHSHLLLHVACASEDGVSVWAPPQLRNDEESAAGERAEDTAGQRSVLGLGKRTRGMVRSPSLPGCPRTLPLTRLVIRDSSLAFAP